MTNQQTIHDIKDNAVTAQRIHDELSSYLIPEQDTKSWILFYELAVKEIPALTGKGRPTKEAIEASFVGRLGFTSWKGYLETPKSKGGLGWTATGWARYKEAYKTMRDHLWLYQADLKPDQIRGLAREYDKDGWPASLTEHRNRKAAAAQERSEANALKKANDAEKLTNYPKLEARIVELEALIQGHLVTEAKLNQDIGVLSERLVRANVEIQAYSQKKPLLRVLLDKIGLSRFFYPSPPVRSKKPKKARNPQ